MPGGIAPSLARPRASTKPISDRAGLGVFATNRARPFHRWYPFVEGYSAELVERALAEPAPDGLVLDPFGGSGTTALAAALQGRDSVFAEVNPYLAWIADVKINQARQVAETPGAADELQKLAARTAGSLPRVDENHPFLAMDRKRRYFPHGTAETILGLLAAIDCSAAGATREVARLAVATSVIPASLMIRRTDLRRRVPSDSPPADLRSTVAQRLRDFAEDIEHHGTAIRGRATCIASDVRSEWGTTPDIAVIVTSPPYLNGTNYCRNTKLELLALGMMSRENDLKELRVASISAGINNVSRRRNATTEIPCVEPVAQRLDEVAYDVRIPILVRTYFADMRLALAQIRRRALPGAQMYFDIGDSRYCGIHVPTHTLLREIAENEHWRFLGEETLRTRRSYDGSQLTQVLLHFEAS